MLTILERLGLAGWFGAAIWFSAFGTSALFGQLGVAGAAGALDVLFASLFWFCVGCGALATAGALGSRSPLRIALAALVLAAGLFLSLVVEPWFAQPGMFAAAHTTSFAVALVAWLAAAAGLIAQRR